MHYALSCRIHCECACMSSDTLQKRVSAVSIFRLSQLFRTSFSLLHKHRTWWCRVKCYLCILSRLIFFSLYIAARICWNVDNLCAWSMSQLYDKLWEYILCLYLTAVWFRWFYLLSKLRVVANSHFECRNCSVGTRFILLLLTGSEIRLRVSV
jgi:hypothetical protein